MSREAVHALAATIAELQAEARAKMRPRDKSKPQCRAVSPRDAGGMCCSLSEGHGGDHDYFDPILGIV